MANVTFTRPELKKLIPIYNLVKDCCNGSFAIKDATVTYLPKPNPTDISKENLSRYAQYLERAVFYNVTKNTLGGLLGQIFAKESEIEIPAELEILLDNCDGMGNGLEQVASQCVEALLKGGRFGLFSDFPSVESELSQDEIITQELRPIIRKYNSEDIINWRYKFVGSEMIKTLIVLREKYTWEQDEFESREQYRYRVLKLNDDDVYQCDVYEGGLVSTNVSTNGTQPVFDLIDSIIPKDAAGSSFDRIPFEFAGCETNIPDPSVPVLYDIATLNIAHYRNSADYEESCYMVGQPTTYFAGLDESWVENVLKGTVQLGSRSGIPLPAGGSAGILQAAPNAMPLEAMRHKEEQFVALGAKLVSPQGAAKTATEANINNTSETSILATLAHNTSEAFENALEHCQKFLGSSGEIKFELNDDFEIAKLTVPERTQLLKEWMSDAISITEYRNNLRKGKVDLLEDDVAMTEIEGEIMDDFEMQKNDPNFVDPKVAMAAKAKQFSVGKKK